MGCCDSSAEHGGYGEVRAAGNGATEAVASGVASGSAEDRSVKARRSVAASVSAWTLLLIVRFYIVCLSPIFGGACRFYPSCSNFAYEAVSRHGAWRGGLLAMKRLLRCHPFTQGGFDPVPDVIYKEDVLEQPKSSDEVGVELALQVKAHRPTQPVVTETWSAAGTLGVERRL
jgi:uncharacterized protein